MPDTCTYNCSAHPTEVNAYGDISGIGVTTAFFATAWMLVLLLIGYYLVAYNPELDPFRQPGKKTPCQHPNATDYIFLYAARKLPGLRNVQHSELLRSSRLESALNQCVMTFADIQIFTSLAVMISGYIALSCGLQSYHWQLMVYLVWLASLTHLAALSFLRNHLAHQPGPRIWRVTAMFFILVLLAVAVGLAGYFVWDDGASKVSDFAICYFGKKMNTKSVAFESMIKTLILLAYGFFIRVAKMSKAFEGGFRRVAAQLSAKAMRLQHGDGVDDAQQWDPHGWLSSAPTMPRRMMRTFFIALCSLSSIHLNFLTSFLAEVYWLSLSALWVTRRYFKTRRLGPEEENEWTFGQVLPVLLVVAPLAAIFEHLLPFRSAANRRRQRPSQIALEIVDQLERDEAQDDVQVDLNQQHINSPAYRGTSFLTAVAYIEAGIFFIVDQSPGIRQPAIRLGASFFILNPLLQLLWIHSVLWISCTDWSCLVKKTVRWATFTAFMAITVNEFILAPLKGSRGDKETLYGSLTSLALVGVSINLPVIISRHPEISGGVEHQPSVLVSIFGAVVTVIPISVPLLVSGRAREFMGNTGVCLCLQLAWYCLELFVGKMDIGPKYAASFRCVLMFCILFALGVLQYRTSVGPRTSLLIGAFTTSALVWVVVDLIALPMRQATTQGDCAPSSS